MHRFFSPRKSGSGIYLYPPLTEGENEEGEREGEEGGRPSGGYGHVPGPQKGWRSWNTE